TFRNASCGCRVQPCQNPVEMCETLSFHYHFEAVSPIKRSGRSTEQPFCESAQIKAGPSDENRQLPPLSDFGNYTNSLALIIPCRENLDGFTDVDHVMRNAPPFFRRRFGRADVHVAEDLDGVVVDDFAGEALCKVEGKFGLAAGSRSDDRD